MVKEHVKKALLISWLTLLLFMLFTNVHAWEVPSYLRITSGARVWFSLIEGDLVQEDRTKLGITDNLGIKQDELAWEFLASARAGNLHVLRVRVEPATLYDQSINDCNVKVRSIRTGYDLDFYMSPQALIGANTDLDVFNLKTRVNDVTVGNSTFNYSEDNTHLIPSVGLHGTFYPILQGIAIRPNISTRVNWWDYQGTETWDWELAAAVDVPVNELWTWTLNGGYRIWNIKLKRERDTVDVIRKGFFLETSILF